MVDNMAYATESIRSSVTSLKKKLSNVRISIEQLDSELEKIEGKFDKLLLQKEIFKAKMEREAGRDVRRLELEVSKLKKQLASHETAEPKPLVSSVELKIASTMGIFECILRNMCGHSDDFLLMSYSFLFPAVYERVVAAEDPHYLLETMPDAAATVIHRGREYIRYIRETCQTHVTDQIAWDTYLYEVTNWWRNDALPLLYGSQDEIWEEDEPLSLAEMLTWRDEPSERPLHFSGVFDAFEIYRNNKDAIYGSCGARDLDLKMFKFDEAEKTEG